MNLPLKARPVARGYSIAAFGGDQVGPSQGIACTLCKAACSKLSGIAHQLCVLACDHTVCH